MTGIASLNNNLYGVSFETDKFYGLDSVTGKATAISSVPFYGLPHTSDNANLSDIESVGSIMYAISTLGRLYIMSVSTGIVSIIGDTGLSGQIKLASNGTTLYALDNNEIYTINTSTGANTSVVSINIPQFTPDATSITFVGDTLYVAIGRLDISPTPANDALYSLDLDTGNLTRISPSSGYSFSETVLQSMCSIGTTIYALQRASNSNSPTKHTQHLSLIHI